jgi:cobalt/nickel transport system permease protein
MNNLLDDYALASPLRHHSNWLKLIIVAFGLLVGVSSSSPATPLFITLSMGFATVFFGKIPLKFYLKLVLLPLGFAAVGSIVILFFFGTGCEVFSFELLGYRLVANTEGVEMALLVVSRTVSGMSCVFFLALSTPMIELFAVVKRSRIPDSVIELSMLMYRYIFLFLDVAISIKDAQTIRLGYTSFRRSLYSIAMLASTLFIRSWEALHRNGLEMLRWKAHSLRYKATDQSARSGSRVGLCDTCNRAPAFYRGRRGHLMQTR